MKKQTRSSSEAARDTSGARNRRGETGVESEGSAAYLRPKKSTGDNPLASSHANLGTSISAQVELHNQTLYIPLYLSRRADKADFVNISRLEHQAVGFGFDS
jgi:hypothetical protein